MSRSTLQHEDVPLYNMPSLEEEKVQSPDDILRHAEEIQRKAYEEGFAAGDKAGREEGEREAAVLIEKISAILTDIAHFKEQFTESMQQQVIDLSLAIARRVILEEINEQPEIVVRMVRESLKKLQKIGTITIKINPALHELFMKLKPQLLELHEDIVFDVSSQVSVAGPIVIGETEEVVTDIDSLLANIGEALKGQIIRGDEPRD